MLRGQGAAFQPSLAGICSLCSGAHPSRQPAAALAHPQTSLWFLCFLSSSVVSLRPQLRNSQATLVPFSALVCGDLAHRVLSIFHPLSQKDDGESPSHGVLSRDVISEFNYRKNTTLNFPQNSSLQGFKWNCETLGGPLCSRKKKKCSLLFFIEAISFPEFFFFFKPKQNIAHRVLGAAGGLRVTFS